MNGQIATHTGAGRSLAHKGHGCPALGGHGVPVPAGAVGPAAVSPSLHIINPADPLFYCPPMQKLPPTQSQVNLTLPRELIDVRTPAQARHYAK